MSCYWERDQQFKSVKCLVVYGRLGRSLARNLKEMMLYKTRRMQRGCPNREIKLLVGIVKRWYKTITGLE